MIGTELMKRMQEQIRLEDIYNVSIQKADGAFMAMDNDDVRETLERLQKNTRELCRKMKDKPTIVADLRNFQETRPANVVQLLRTLADMQDVTLKRLTTTVEEEKSRAELLHSYETKRDEADNRRKNLEVSLSHIRREREKASQERTEVIAKLTQTFEAEMEKHRTKHREVTEAFAKRLHEMKGQYEETKEKHRETEETLRKKKVRAEENLNQVISEYDTKIEDMTNDYEANVIDFDKEQKQLEELQEHFEKVDAEKMRQ